MAMKKLILISMTIALLFGIFIIPIAEGSAVIASRYNFKVGDRVCIRKSASFYTNINGRWSLSKYRSNVNVGTIKSIKTVKLSFSENVKLSLPRTEKLFFQPDIKSITLYEIANCIMTKGSWVDDIAPTFTYGNQPIIFDAYKGEIHVNLKASNVRKLVLNNALDIAKALQLEHKNLGYDKYFKVDIEYFTWELIAHAYAAEYGLPGYWDSSIADCNISNTDIATKAMIEMARVLWKKGPEKTW